MSERLVGGVLYPLHEWLRGRDTLRRVREWRALMRLGPDDVAADARRRLRDQLRLAVERRPFYAERFARYGVDLQAADLAAELCKLPPLTKADIRPNADAMTIRNVPGGIKRGCTGGTTGDRLHFWVDRVYGAQNMAARLYMHTLFGVRPGDRRMYLWGSPVEQRGGRLRRWRDRALNEILLDAFDMGAARMDAHLRRIARFRPRLIYGYPSALALLAQHAAKTRVRRDFSSLRVIIATGETITPEHRAQITEVFGCPVAAEYGAREVGLIAHECPRGGLHILAPIAHVAVTSGGRAVPRGTVGEVVTTTLNTIAQPLLHYRVGDAGALLDGACPCGLPLPLMRLESGKILGFIALPDGRLCNGAITSHILRDRAGIVHYRTHQRSRTHYDIYLVVDDSFDRATVAQVRQRYREVFGPDVVADCHIVERIPPDPSGKHRYVVSDVASDYTEFEFVPVEDVLRV